MARDLPVSKNIIKNVETKTYLREKTQRLRTKCFMIMNGNISRRVFELLEFEEADRTSFRLRRYKFCKRVDLIGKRSDFFLSGVELLPTKYPLLSRIIAKCFIKNLQSYDNCQILSHHLFWKTIERRPIKKEIIKNPARGIEYFN